MSPGAVPRAPTRRQGGPEDEVAFWRSAGSRSGRRDIGSGPERCPRREQDGDDLFLDAAALDTRVCQVHPPHQAEMSAARVTDAETGAHLEERRRTLPHGISATRTRSPGMWTVTPAPDRDDEPRRADVLGVESRGLGHSGRGRSAGFSLLAHSTSTTHTSKSASRLGGMAREAFLPYEIRRDGQRSPPPP